MCLQPPFINVFLHVPVLVLQYQHRPTPSDNTVDGTMWGDAGRSLLSEHESAPVLMTQCKHLHSVRTF